MANLVRISEPASLALHAAALLARRKGQRFSNQQIVTPALFVKFSRKVYEKTGDEEDGETTGSSAPLHLAEQFK